MAEILMPPGGQTTNSSVITKWHKKEGDGIKRGDILFSIETDKATLDIESFAEGVLVKCLYKEGDAAETGAVVAVVEASATGSAKVAAETAKIEKIAAEPVKAAPTAVQFAATPPKTNDSRTLASPLAKFTAREHNVDVSKIAATGEVVKKADVLKYINNRQSVSAASGNNAFIVIDVNISTLGEILAQYKVARGKEIECDRYILKAFDVARKDFKEIENIEIGEIRKANEATASVSAVICGNVGQGVIFNFIAKVKLFMDNILLLLAV